MTKDYILFLVDENGKIEQHLVFYDQEEDHSLRYCAENLINKLGRYLYCCHAIECDRFWSENADD